MSVHRNDGPATGMRLQAVELRRVELPLRSPFRTSFGTETTHDCLLVHVVTDAAEGWAECVAMPRPAYSTEYLDGAADVLTRWLVPGAFGLSAAGRLTAEAFGPAVEWIKGHRMATAALEAALLDAQLRTAGRSLSGYLGAVTDRVPTGVSIGIMDSVPELLDVVAGYLEAGYLRIKLKIEPGWDIGPVRAVRERFGDDLLLQVDANTAYNRADADHLAGLDPFGLLLIEQPLDEEDLPGHALLAARVSTPICLDESIVSARSARDAIESGACSIVNIKPGRVGGYLESVRIHDTCRELGVAVWCGGMLETGIGRAANLALAALPGFTLPGDTSATDRYYHQDITRAFVIEDGHVAVPTGPGIGVEPDPDVLAEVTSHRTWLRE
jgi:O-succinylbenzoate synthase